VSLREGAPPEARKDPIIMISMVFSPNYKGRRSLVLATRAGEGVDFCDSEKDMLEGMINIINEYDPDVLTGFNCNNFDLPYILERMRQNNVRPVFGRCKSKGVFAKKLGNRHKVSITGRVIVDSFEIIKKDFSLQRYGLDFVSERLLNKNKEGVKHSEIERLWKGDGAGYNRLVKYSRVDSVLAMDLILELKLMDKYGALSKIAGTLLQDTLEGGETGRIENFLLREFNQRGYMFPCRPAQVKVI
jgi:DNA polymerase I